MSGERKQVESVLVPNPEHKHTPAYVRDVFNRGEENKANFRKAK